MQNEQYPYNLNIKDSLTELSPEETEQWFEDAFSLSSRSPLSDDLTESSLSLQNSPGDPNIADEYLNFPNVPSIVKQEELSPTYISDQFDSSTQQSLMQMSNMNIVAAGDLQNMLQKPVTASCPPKDISAFLQKPDEASISISNVISISNDTDDPQSFSHSFGNQSPMVADSATSAKNACANHPAESLMELLQTSNVGEHNDMNSKQKSGVKKKPMKAKRQKADAQNLSQLKKESVTEVKSQITDSKKSVKFENLQSTATVSQVML